MSQPTPGGPGRLPTGQPRAQGAHVAPGGGLGPCAPTRRISALDATVGHTARVARTGRDPGGMTAAERLAEVGALLARAHRRLQLVNRNGLGMRAEAEPSSDPAVDGASAGPAEEVA